MLWFFPYIRVDSVVVPLTNQRQVAGDRRRLIKRYAAANAEITARRESTDCR